jgi:hypothetical protein
MVLKQIISAHGVFLLIGVVVFFSSGTAAAAQTLTITDVAKYDIDGMAEGLSGLTWAGGNQYYAIEDSGAKLHPMTIDVNLSTGGIGLVTFVSHITLTGGSDLEGVAWNAANNSVYVSDETGATIKEYSLTGTYLSSVNVPAVYGNYRSNKSLESLSLQAGHLSMWTANEEALSTDGPLSTTTNGTIVRLQKFDSGLNPIGQWAYLTEPITSYALLTDDECCGVSDLCVLPNGKILLLERELNGEGFMGTPQFTNRIYEIDFAAATDVSTIASLEGATYTAVTKHLLWSADVGWANFEGLALGPQLDNDDYSLLLISDGDGEATESLYSLRLSGDVPEPASASLLLLGAVAILRRRRR